MSFSTHNIPVATEGLLDKGWNAGEQGIESPIVAKVSYNNCPHCGRRQDVVPRSLPLNDGGTGGSHDSIVLSYGVSHCHFTTY